MRVAVWSFFQNIFQHCSKKYLLRHFCMDFFQILWRIFKRHFGWTHIRKYMHPWNPKSTLHIFWRNSDIVVVRVVGGSRGVPVCWWKEHKQWQPVPQQLQRLISIKFSSRVCCEIICQLISNSNIFQMVCLQSDMENWKYNVCCTALLSAVLTRLLWQESCQPKFK